MRLSHTAHGAVRLKRSLLDILACPVCKSYPLVLTVAEERDGEIFSGSLKCARCSLDYPIEDGIPNLLPPERAACHGDR